MQTTRTQPGNPDLNHKEHKDHRGISLCSLRSLRFAPSDVAGLLLVAPKRLREGGTAPLRRPPGLPAPSS